MENIIVDTDNLYAEFPSDYNNLVVSLNPVMKRDGKILRELEDTVNLFIKRKLESSLSAGETGGMPMALNWREPKELESLSGEILYEVVLCWDKYIEDRQSQHRREGSFRTHGMSLEEAKLEKKAITQQIAQKHKVSQLVERYLFDDASVAVGLIGSEFEKEIAQIIYKHRKETKIP